MRSWDGAARRVSSSLCLATFALATLAACAPANPRLVAPPESYQTLEQNGTVVTKVDFQPKVDVLFVVDNSDSMKLHQENLKRNVDRFVEAFEDDGRLDFQIGVVSVFDSKRFGPVVKDYYPLGKLRPLKDPRRPQEPVEGPPFVRRVPGYAELLGESLKIGTQARGTTKNDLGGPEYEESFTPVMAALDGRNPGFLRPEAHLAVVMITDANDDSAVSAARLDQFLWELKGRDRSRISTFAVLALDGCKQDPGGPPLKILEFLRFSRGRAYNLCAPDYGDRLAEAGRLIQAKAARLKIPLQAIPEIDTLRVTVGGRLLEQHPLRGWSYDPEKVALVISGEAQLKGTSGEQLEITYVPIDPRKMDSDRVERSTNQE